MLWLDKHKKEERIIPPEIQDLLDKGNEFGDRAMGMFGEFVEITTYTEDGRLDYKTMLAKTTECLNNGTPVICEAAFSYYNNYCAVDILRRVEGGYELYEVKNSKEVSETFEKDLAFQRYILKKCGVKIIKAAVVTHGADENNPYIINDCTSILAIQSYLPGHRFRYLPDNKHKRVVLVSVGSVPHRYSLRGVLRHLGF